MSRRRAAEKRTILPDHKFKDLILAKFINRIMIDGKKSASERIVYGAFDIVSKKTEKSPIDFFHDALNYDKSVSSRNLGYSTGIVHCQCSAIRKMIQSKHFSSAKRIGLLKGQPRARLTSCSLPNRGS